MADKSDRKKQLEALTGEAIPEEALGQLQLLWPIAHHTRSSSVTTLQNLFPPPTNFCRESRELDLSGSATTAANGKAVFKLSQFLCPMPREAFAYPINFLATPHTVKPYFLTATHTLLPNGVDVEVTVFAWEPGGRPAGGVYFHWRCRLAIVPAHG